MYGHDWLSDCIWMFLRFIWWKILLFYFRYRRAAVCFHSNSTLLHCYRMSPLIMWCLPAIILEWFTVWQHYSDTTKNIFTNTINNIQTVNDWKDGVKYWTYHETLVQMDRYSIYNLAEWFNVLNGWNPSCRWWTVELKNPKQIYPKAEP